MSEYANKAKRNGEDVDTEQSYQSASVIAHDITEKLLKKGYRLEPDNSGKHANHSIYIKARLEVNRDVHYWKVISTEIEWNGFKATLESSIGELAHNGSDYLSVARKLQYNLIDQGADRRTVMAGVGYASSLYREARADRSFTGKLAFKQIPRLYWFPDLKTLSPYELLSLFPPAEAKALMLMLGRSMCGVGGTTSYEGVISHRMRSAAIIVGIEAGLGKSSLLTGLIEAMEKLGYSTEPVVAGNARFGWGAVAESDLAYRDDLNQETQTAILKSEKLKTIITGGRLSTERKGIDSDMTMAKTTVLCCSNDYNIYDFFKMDEGSISRFNFLYTYNAKELVDKFPDFDARTDKNFLRLSEQYSVSLNRLYSYLLAHSVEYFLEVLGLSVINDQLVMVAEDRLQLEMLELRGEFIYSPSVTHVKDLVLSTASMVALAIATIRKKVKRDEVLAYLPHTGFDYALVHQMVHHYAQSVTNKEPWDLKGIDSGCKRAVKKRLEDVGNKQGSRNAIDAFAFIMSELFSDQGATFPKSPGNYVRMWTEARKAIPDLVDKYAEEQDFDEFPNYLKKLLPCVLELLGMTSDIP